MKIVKRTASIFAAIIGILFLFNVKSDIQLGFGLVLLFNGLIGWE